MANRRDEILSAAKVLFGSRGVRNTTMRDIADACGLLAGSLYSHFKSKNEIVQIILLPFYERLLPLQQKIVESEGTGAERLDLMIRSVFPVLFEFGDEMTIVHYNWFDFMGVDEFEPFKADSRKALQFWFDVVRAGIEDGSLRQEIDPEFAVRAITSSLHGVLDPKRYESLPSPVSETGFEGLVDQFVMLMMSGLGSLNVNDEQHHSKSLSTK